MSKTEGEYELVLGNRQLLSAFFIIVILFGVFFTMGYVVWRNSAPASAASSTAPSVAANVKPDAASPAPAQTATPPAAPPVDAPKETARIETKPVAPVEKSEKAEAPPPKRTPMKPVQPEPTKAAAGSAGVPTITPGPGRMYLQVAAVAQPQAGVVVDTLKQKGFPAMLAQGPNATLFRVVVGPYPDAASAGKAKAGLESAGFHPILRK